MKIQFIKERYYKTKKYRKGDVLEITFNDGQAFVNAGAAKPYVECKLPDIDDVEKMLLPELKETALRHGLPVDGKKAEILERIINHMERGATDVRT